jgi:hypothetical protein
MLRATLEKRDAEIRDLKEKITDLQTRSPIAGVKASPSTVPAFLSPASVHAANQIALQQYLDKWKSFRGLKWGINIVDVPGMVLVEDHPDSKYYQRKSDKLIIGEAKLVSITYNFYKGRFGYVRIEAKGFSNWISLRDAVFATYGKGRQPNQFMEEWYWDVEDVWILLRYSEITEKVSLSISYRPIDNEKEADKDKKAKEAKEDF